MEVDNGEEIQKTKLASTEMTAAENRRQ